MEQSKATLAEKIHSVILEMKEKELEFVMDETLSSEQDNVKNYSRMYRFFIECESELEGGDMHHEEVVDEIHSKIFIFLHNFAEKLIVFGEYKRLSELREYVEKIRKGEL